MDKHQGAGGVALIRIPNDGNQLENNQPEMTADAALELMCLFDAHHLEVILDGGWAVDALLGCQTRPHADLDIAMPHRFVPELRSLLERRGYREVPRSDSWDCNFVLGDQQGHQVDVHTYTFDEQGNLLFGEPYPPGSLAGHGTLLGHPVGCITPEWLVRFHTGYALDENDDHDVRALCQRFGIDLPDVYSRFNEESNDFNL
jgi:lincosamide nucleotidyltransferase A/C/D/E